MSDRTALISRSSAPHYAWAKACDGWRLIDTPGLTVVEERVPPGAEEMRHYHNEARQFFYVLSGTAVVGTEEREHQIPAGSGIEVSPGIQRNRVRTGGVGVCAGTPEALMPEKLHDRFSDRLACVVVQYDTLNHSVNRRNRRTVELKLHGIARIALPRFIKRRNIIEIGAVGVDCPVHELRMTDDSDGRKCRFIGGSVNPIGARIHRRIPVKDRPAVQALFNAQVLRG